MSMKLSQKISEHLDTLDEYILSLKMIKEVIECKAVSRERFLKGCDLEIEYLEKRREKVQEDYNESWFVS